MNPSFERIMIRATSSRLAKGLLAIPQRFVRLLPAEKCDIHVQFDNQSRLQTVTYKPYDDTTKEARIFGLGNWFSTSGVQEGDVICIIVKDREKRSYRIALERLIKAEEEAEARIRFTAAQTDSLAELEFRTLTRLTRKSAMELAKEEVLRIAGETPCTPRPRSSVTASIRSDGVPSGLRVLLQKIHEGKCQLCSFTFQRRDGEPYFELHHLDPTVGHHPHNLLVLCANCHAQFEHAKLTNLISSENWLVSVSINGKRFTVRQPLAEELTRRKMLDLGLLFVAAQIWLRSGQQHI